MSQDETGAPRRNEDTVVMDSEHLTPEIVAAYLAHETTADEHRAAQQHLLTCGTCRADVAAAAALTAGRRPRRWVAVVIPAAAAAVALFLIVPGQGTRPDLTTTRGPGTEGVRQFATVTPGDGTPVTADSVVFRWRSEGPRAHYVLTVTDQNGDVVWTAGTPDTSLVPPRGAGLKPGNRYFWYVDALLEGARSSTTGVREFTIRP